MHSKSRRTLLLLGAASLLWMTMAVLQGACDERASAACGPSSCDGCCREGVCFTGAEDSACGPAGQECDDCTARSQRCLAGQCLPGAIGGGREDAGAGDGGAADAGSRDGGTRDGGAADGAVIDGGADGGPGDGGAADGGAVDGGGANGGGARAVAAGGAHSCAVTSVGGVKCWGDNSTGQLGDGTKLERHSPVVVSGLSGGVGSLSAGRLHTCAVVGPGAAMCWGYNGQGQLGDGTWTDSAVPVAVSGLSSGVKVIAAGQWFHTCALMISGGLKCWGSNQYGQLGDGTTTSRGAPVDVPGFSSGVSGIAVGSNHTCVLLTTGAVECWGNNFDGQLGDGTGSDSSVPVVVSGLSSGVSAIAAGSNHSCALLNTGVMECWGANVAGEIGDGTTSLRKSPVAVLGLPSGVGAIAAGGARTCALLNSGALMCWGDNGSGQLGIGSTAVSLRPVSVFGLSSGVGTVATGLDHTCALKSAGGLLCWGVNFHGQIGDGTTTNASTPVGVVGF